MAGGENAKAIPSGNPESLRLSMAMIASARSPLPRSDHSLSRMKKLAL
jgi:hypothetical protein